MTALNKDDQALLAEICKGHDVSKHVVDELLGIEQDLFGMGRRHGLYERIAEILEKAVRDREAKE